MSDFYVYLISSLPSLSFGAKPPLSFSVFMKTCEKMVPDEDIALLAKLSEPVGSSRVSTKNITFNKWIEFEIVLRNELVKVRALRRKTDPVKYLRENGFPESALVAHMAINAYRKPSLMDAARTLDLDRWQYLDSLAVGHYFDLDTLIIYACKLKILERWQMVDSAESGKILEEVMS